MKCFSKNNHFKATDAGYIPFSALLWFRFLLYIQQNQHLKFKFEYHEKSTKYVEEDKHEEGSGESELYISENV